MNKKRTIIISLLILISLASLIYSIYELTKTSSENTVLLGLSFERLLLLFFIILLTMIIVSFLVLFFFESEQLNTLRLKFLGTESKINKLLLTLLFFCFIFWLLYTFPAVRVGNVSAYWLKLEVVFLSLFVNTVILSVFIFIFELGNHPLFNQEYFQSNGKIFAAVLLLTGLILFGLRLMGQGLLFDEERWNVAGVPILVEYLYLFIGFQFFSPAFKSIYNLKTTLKLKTFTWMIVIWLFTILIIQPLPIARNIWLYTPDVTGTEYFPREDAQRYDFFGQAFINGLGIGFGSPSDKPMYEAYLGFLHFVAGNNYVDVIRLNVAFLALIPVFLFLIGSELESKAFGIWLAFFGIVIERTANLSSGIISDIHWKLLMSESLTQLAVLIAVFSFLRWLNTRKLFWLGCAAAMIGIGAYIHPHMILLVFILPIIILFNKSEKRSTQLLNLGFSVLSFLSTLLPWAIYCKKQYRYIPLFSKFTYILRTRINSSSVIISSGKLSSTAPIFNSVMITINNAFDSLRILFSHFFNNLIKALLILPYSLQMKTVPQIYKGIGYWDEPNILLWDGQVSFVFILSLILFSLGCVLLIQKKKMLGAVPLLAMILYFGALAFSRTSGSRYLVPVNWVVLLYYIYALFWLGKQALSIVFNIETISKPAIVQNDTKFQFRKAGVLLGLTLVIGLLFPAFDYFIPENTALVASEQQISEWAVQQEVLNFINIEPSQWSAFLESKNVEYGYGKILYPIDLANENLEQARFQFSILGNYPLRGATALLSRNDFGQITYTDNHFVLACKDTASGPAVPFFIQNIETEQVYFSQDNWKTCYQFYFD